MAFIFIIKRLISSITLGDLFLWFPSPIEINSQCTNVFVCVILFLGCVSWRRLPYRLEPKCVCPFILSRMITNLIQFYLFHFLSLSVVGTHAAHQPMVVSKRGRMDGCAEPLPLCWTLPVERHQRRRLAEFGQGQTDGNFFFFFFSFSFSLSSLSWRKMDAFIECVEIGGFIGRRLS